MQDWRSSALVVVLLLWAGILFGVSFLATPVKFSAPSLTLPVAIEVGRSTFALLNRVELGCAAISVGLLIVGASRTLSVCLSAGVAVLGVLLETFWLLPVLDQRAQAVIDGAMPTASSLHDVYIGIDLAKLAGLLVAAVVLLGPDKALHHEARLS
jgi:hypothetical protein